jgi:pentatricopeptide repeat protein
MKQQGVAPDVHAYRGAISACRAAGDWRKAAHLLQEMQQARIKPSVLCYNTVLDAYCKAGKGQRTLALPAEMKQHCTPTAFSYNTAMKACIKSGKWQLALDLLQR